MMFIVALIGVCAIDLARDASRTHCAVCHRGWAVFPGPHRHLSERRCYRHRVAKRVRA